MARITGVLTNVNDALTIKDVDENNGGVSITYKTGGLGTIVVEVSALDSQTNVNGNLVDDDEWVQLKLRNPSAAVNADVDNLAAAGIAWADIIGVKKVRVRKSVAGAGPVTVTLTVNNF